MAPNEEGNLGLCNGFAFICTAPCTCVRGPVLNSSTIIIIRSILKQLAIANLIFSLCDISYIHIRRGKLNSQFVITEFSISHAASGHTINCESIQFAWSYYPLLLTSCGRLSLLD